MPMACIASSPSRPSIACDSSLTIRSPTRSCVAMKRSFLVPKSRKRYGWEIPARAAMASVEVPA